MNPHDYPLVVACPVLSKVGQMMQRKLPSVCAKSPKLEIENLLVAHASSLCGSVSRYQVFLDPFLMVRIWPSHWELCRWAEIEIRFNQWSEKVSKHLVHHFSKLLCLTRRHVIMCNHSHYTQQKLNAKHAHWNCYTDLRYIYIIKCNQRLRSAEFEAGWTKGGKACFWGVSEQANCHSLCLGPKCHKKCHQQKRLNWIKMILSLRERVAQEDQGYRKCSPSYS